MAPKRTVLGILLVASVQATATELVYQPVNPNFGGNPLNGTYLLGQAQAQNDPESQSRSTRSALDQFNDSLQRSILSRISTAISRSIVSSDGDITPGSIDTENFSIDVVDLGNGQLRVTTVDKATGASNTFEVDSNL